MPNRRLSAVIGCPDLSEPWAHRRTCDAAPPQWISTAPHKPRERLAFWVDFIAPYSQAFVVPSTPVHVVHTDPPKDDVVSSQEW